MHHVRMFLLHFQFVLENRARALVYFLISLLNPLILVAFWDGAAAATGTIGDTGWTSADMTAYYYLLIVASAGLMTHIDMYVGAELIQEGGIVRYLLKPFSFFWMMFHTEIGYRVFSGLLGIASVLILTLVFGRDMTIAQSWVSLLLASWVAINGLFISFIFRMIEGITAFFITDIRGLRELMEVTILLFGGFVMPMVFFPDKLRLIAEVSPFPYMIYYPVVAFQGLLSTQELVNVIMIQLGWISGFVAVYTLMWRAGVRRFTAVGN